MAIVAMLLLAAFVTAPAYAQDAGGATPPPGPSDQTPPTPPANPPADQTPPTPPANPPADQTPPPTPPADPPADPGPTGSGSTTTPPPSDTSGGDTASKQPAHPPADQFTTSGSSAAATPTSSSPATPGKDAAGTKAGYSDSWLGQDTFTLSKSSPTTHDRITTMRRKFAGLFLLGASTQATRMEAKARRAHETAKVSALGSGPPAPGSPLPNQNPFFNLMSGPSGIAAGLMLASMLAVLGAAFVLPRDRQRAFRTPTVTWSPLAYVPPIELPG